MQDPRFSLLGVDVSQPTSLTDFKCLKASGHKFAIVRAYQSIGMWSCVFVSEMTVRFTWILSCRLWHSVYRHAITINFMPQCRAALGGIMCTEGVWVELHWPTTIMLFLCLSLFHSQVHLTTMHRPPFLTHGPPAWSMLTFICFHASVVAMLLAKSSLWVSRPLVKVWHTLGCAHVCTLTVWVDPWKNYWSMCTYLASFLVSRA